MCSSSAGGRTGTSVACVTDPFAAAKGVPERGPIRSPYPRAEAAGRLHPALASRDRSDLSILVRTARVLARLMSARGRARSGRLKLLQLVDEAGDDSESLVPERRVRRVEAERGQQLLVAL